MKVRKFYIRFPKPQHLLRCYFIMNEDIGYLAYDQIWTRLIHLNYARESNRLSFFSYISTTFFYGRGKFDYNAKSFSCDFYIKIHRTTSFLENLGFQGNHGCGIIENVAEFFSAICFITKISIWEHFVNVKKTVLENIRVVIKEIAVDFNIF